MTFFRQIGAATLIALKTLPSRRTDSLVVMIGMACAVGALTAILSLSAGYLRMMENSGRPDRAIVLAHGAPNEWGSTIASTDVGTVADIPGIRKATDGRPIMSPEKLDGAPFAKKSGGSGSVTVRGIGPEGIALRPDLKLLRGRMFQRGKFEAVAGQAAAAQFKGLEVGDRFLMPNGLWTITGVFANGGGDTESQLLVDGPTLLAVMRNNLYQSVTALLNSPADFAQFRQIAEKNPAVALDVYRETDFLAQESKPTHDLLANVAYVVAGIMGLGAMFGALNTMYSSISARAMEIATLRAIGFGGGAVIVSVLLEALLLALAGAVIGVFLAWLLFDSNSHILMGTVIRLAVTPPVMLQGIAFACLLGFIGGLFPAIRAASGPVANALRAT